MRTRFYPCATCERHVRVDETECPFCNAELSIPPEARQFPRLPQKRLSSLALKTFHTALIGAVAGACSGEVEEHRQDRDAGPDTVEVDGGGRNGSGGSSGTSSRGGSVGSGADSSGGNTDDAKGGSSDPGFDAGTDPFDGGPVPIYRATPRG